MGVPSTLNFNTIKLDIKEALTIEFPIPAKIVSISMSVKGIIKPMIGT